ncbi:hypothetical protein KUL49_10800 [Alteromonas sp. KUL49]|nr:hypothetical protein EYS00_05355 [Alteromonas sp. KUL49]GEA10705.1 hypothetical protein KUL49_10800 [Alteromonas sp. KUL49]
MLFLGTLMCVVGLIFCYAMMKDTGINTKYARKGDSCHQITALEPIVSKAEVRRIFRDNV